MWDQVYNLETCGRSWINTCEKLVKRVMNSDRNIPSADLPNGRQHVSRLICSQQLLVVTKMKWGFWFSFFHRWIVKNTTSKQTEAGASEGRINAPLLFWTLSFHHLKTEVWIQLEWGGWLEESAPMGAGCDPVWPRFDLAVTFDFSGPGSPPALLPGFGNAPPWGPERANQNEEEPQCAVGDWRRGKNINSQGKT